MANKKIRGITVEIGGDTTKLGKAIENNEKQTRSLKSELRDVEKLLKFDPSNTELLTQKQNILTNAIHETSQKLNVMKEAEEQIVEQYERGEIGEEQLRAYQREIMQTQNQLEQFERDLASTIDAMENIGQETEQTASALEELESTIQSQEDELRRLNRQYAEVVLSQGESSEETQELERQMTELNQELRNNRERLNDAQTAADSFTDALNDVQNETDDTGDGFTIMKGAMADLVSEGIQGAISAVGDLIGSLFELVEATEEYRLMQAKLEGSSDSFGYSLEYTKEKYKELYGYLGDDQMATNAITNLLGLRLETDTLNKLVDGAVSVWASYGDSIPIESLTESMNETIQVSKVTGVMADTINWAKMSNEQWSRVLGNGTSAQKAFNKAIKEGLPYEDAFSEALLVTTDAQERAEMVARLLNDTYGASKAKVDELTGGVQNANRAEVELKETQAELAKAIEPVNTKMVSLKEKALQAILPVVEDLMEGLLDLLEWFEETPGATEAVIAVIGGLAAAFGVLAVALGIQALISGVQKAMALLNATMLANPVVLVTAGIVGLTAGLIALSSQTDETKQKQEELTEAINEETESWKALKEAQAEQLQANLAEIDYVSQLKSELDGLVDKNGKIKEGYESRAGFIMNELSQATGLEIESVNGVIQKYGELSSSIDNVIAKKRAQIILDSQEGAYQEAITKRTEALTKMNQFEAEMLDAKRELDAGYADAEDARTRLEKQAAELRIRKAEEEYTNKSTVYENQKSLVLGYNETIAQYENDAKLIASGNAEDIAKINSRYAASYNDKGEKVVLSLQQQITNEESLLAYWKEQYAKTNDEMYLDQIEATNNRLAQLNSDLTAQKSTVDTKKPLIVGSWASLIQESLNKFKAPSQQFKTEAEKQVTNAKTGVDNKKPQYTNAMGSTANEGFNKFNSKQGEYKPTGEQAIEGVKKGVDNKKGSLWDTLWGVGQGMLNSLKNALSIKSPSKKMELEIGEQSVEGVEVGIVKNTPKAISAVEDMGVQMIDSVHGMGLDRAISDSIVVNGATVQTESSDSLSSKIDTLINLVSDYLPDIATNSSRQIVLDSGTVVGELAPDMDVALADIASTKKRGG